MNVVDDLFQNSKALPKELVLGNEEKITYPELWQQICTIADFLHKTIGEEQKVLLISDNSVFFIAAYFGIMKSGNIVVPLNPTTEAKTLTYIQTKCQAKFCFTQKKFKTKLAIPDVELIDEDAVHCATVVAEANGKQNTVSRDDGTTFDAGRMAAILFTSGSTALPKGVMLSHANLQANTVSIIDYLRLTASDTVEVVLPFFYCYGLSLLHTHVKVGGSLVLNNNFLLLSTVVDDVSAYHCTGFAGVPSHFQILLRRSDLTKRTFPCLRYVTQAGGKLAEPFIREFVAAFPTVKFYVMYGQTEATARLSYLPPELLATKAGSIGKGLAGVKLEVLNQENKAVQRGEIGEIVASGQNIMLGYFDDERESQKVLQNGKLRTGDLGTVDEDGYIYLVAREKEILKVGGERISPKEIEAVLVALPEILDCSIVGVADETLGEAIKALIVLNDQAERIPTESEIRTYCHNRLARNKIPKIIQFVAQIPMNTTGKKTQSMIHQASQ